MVIVYLENYKRKGRKFNDVCFEFVSRRNPVNSKTEAIRAHITTAVIGITFFLSALAGSGYHRIEETDGFYYNYLPCPLGTFMDSSSTAVFKNCTPCPPGK